MSLYSFLASYWPYLLALYFIGVMVKYLIDRWADRIMSLTLRQWVILLIIICCVGAAIGDVINSLGVTYTTVCTPGVSRIGPPCGNGWG